MTTPVLNAYDLAGEARSTVLDGSGNGKAQWSPGQSVSAGAGYTGGGYSRNGWYSVDLTGVAVSVATHVAESQAACYISYGTLPTNLNPASPDFVGQTQKGSTGDTGTFTARLRPGDWVTVVWTGGDPGQVATLRIIGTANPPGS